MVGNTTIHGLGPGLALTGHVCPIYSQEQLMPVTSCTKHLALLKTSQILLLLAHCFSSYTKKDGVGPVDNRPTTD